MQLQELRGPAGSAAGTGSQDGEGVGGQKVISLDLPHSFSRGVLAQVENMSFAGKRFGVWQQALTVGLHFREMTFCLYKPPAW